VLFATLGARYDSALADLGVSEAQRGAACRRRQGQRGSCDSRPGCQSGYCSCRRACAGRLHRRLAGGSIDSRRLPRHRTGGKPVSREPTPPSIN
jgi:hypothetical protein